MNKLTHIIQTSHFYISEEYIIVLDIIIHIDFQRYVLGMKCKMLGVTIYFVYFNTESTLDTANEQKLILQLLNIFLLTIIILVPKVHYYKIDPT